MDFRLFFEQIKQLTDPAIFAIIAKFAIAFYFLKLLFKGFKELLKFIFAVKEKKEGYEEMQKNYEELQKTNLENKEQITQLKEAHKEANVANEKRDLKTHKLLEAFQIDLNAYKQRTHAIENEKHALVDLVKSNMELIQKMEKYVK
jgi:hypothetical protein